jgi:Phage integrase family
MNRQAVTRFVARLAKRAGVTKHISPHSLRHSFITAAQLGTVVSGASFDVVEYRVGMRDKGLRTAAWGSPRGPGSPCPVGVSTGPVALDATIWHPAPVAVGAGPTRRIHPDGRCSILRRRHAPTRSIVQWGITAELFLQTTTMLREALGDERLRELRAEGGAMDDDSVVTLTLDAVTRARASVHPSTPPR